jgi:glycosyltransferase involved in cell wall biosynthesis
MISVIIPAHNEASVIARTLRAMTDGVKPGELDIIVVCNGCVDDTAEIGRDFGFPVRVIETATAGKTHALNLGDAAAQGFPRVYADADVLLPPDSLRALARRLEQGDVIAVAPRGNIDLAGCSWLVRAYYGIRSLLPSANEGIGGSGVYALSEAGRRRFREFPAVTADDGFVRIQFRPEERETVLAASSTVFPPRTLKTLIATKTRSHFGSLELMRMFPEQWHNRGESNNQSLLRLFRQPGLWPKLGAYCLITLLCKREARNRLRRAEPVRWERDHTSRAPVAL